MKKAAIILIISIAGIAILFAQVPGKPQQTNQSAAAEISSAVSEAAEPVTAERPAAPEPAEASGEVAEEPEIVVTDELTMTDEVGEDALIEQGRISLRLKGAELQDVVRLFSALSDANIIVPALAEEDVQQKIDVNLDNVEWKPALEAILDTHELELYEKIPGTAVYSIRQKAPGAPDPIDVEVFKLNYASVDSVTSVVSRLVGNTGSYAVFHERNVVVAQATAKALQRLTDIIKQIDLPRQQVFIEAKFLELSDQAQRDLGVNWQVLEAYKVGARNLGMDYNNTIIDEAINSQHQVYDIAGRAYEEADAAVIDLPARPGSFGPDETRIAGVTPTRTDTQSDKDTVTKALTAVLGADDFELVLSALEQKDGVDLVSNPKIIVANEEEAVIHLGQKEPNIKIERTAGTSDNPGGSLSVGLDGDVPYFEDGVKVVVTPTINTASNIMVSIRPELTSFIGRKSVEADGTFVEYPISLTKTVDTVFSLESGQTAAIGGLTQTEERNSRNAIPILGDLPVVGRFFSYEQKVLDQNETIIFVTVGLANPSSIDMETGLPQNTRLAQKYRVRAEADRSVEKAKLELFRTKENEEMRKEILRLRSANEKLIEKQEEKKAKDAAKAAKEAAKQAEREAEEAAKVAVEAEQAEAGPVVAEPILSVESVAVAEEVAPVQTLEEPVNSVEQIIEALESVSEDGTSGGGTYSVKPAAKTE